MKNKEIASLFSRIADALEIKGELAFKVLACRKAAATLEDLGQDIEACGSLMTRNMGPLPTRRHRVLANGDWEEKVCAR
jgi:DNA polymerase/3'-5' exonuclease PolX